MVQGFRKVHDIRKIVLLQSVHVIVHIYMNSDL